MLNPVREIGRFSFTQSQRDRFITEMLWHEWGRRYPELFDADDLRLAESQANLGYHFFEWLGAILLYETTGYLSLVEKYEFECHKRKQAIVRQLLPREVVQLLDDRAGQGGTQFPDLLVYATDLSDWYFCEVKGPGDRLSEAQVVFFEKLTTVSGRQVGVITLVERQAGMGRFEP